MRGFYILSFIIHQREKSNELLHDFGPTQTKVYTYIVEVGMRGKRLSPFLLWKEWVLFRNSTSVIVRTKNGDIF